MTFDLVKKFDGETYKLATLHGGVSLAKAVKTCKMNKAEGNLCRIVKEKRKYASYVKKSSW